MKPTKIFFSLALILGTLTPAALLGQVIVSLDGLVCLGTTQTDTHTSSEFSFSTKPTTLHPAASAVPNNPGAQNLPPHLHRSGDRATASLGTESWTGAGRPKSVSSTTDTTPKPLTDAFNLRSDLGVPPSSASTVIDSLFPSQDQFADPPRVSPSGLDTLPQRRHE